MPGNIGPTEILIVLAVVLVVFGAKRLPELGANLGRGLREFKGGIVGESEHPAEEDGDSSSGGALPVGSTGTKSSDAELGSASTAAVGANPESNQDR